MSIIKDNLVYKLNLSSMSRISGRANRITRYLSTLTYCNATSICGPLIYFGANVFLAQDEGIQVRVMAT